MKLKYNFVTNTVAENIVAVAVGDDMSKFNGFIKMNTTGAEIFEALKEEISLEALTENMIAEYPDENPERIKQTVVSFVEELENAGVLE